MLNETKDSDYEIEEEPELSELSELDEDDERELSELSELEDDERELSELSELDEDDERELSELSELEDDESEQEGEEGYGNEGINNLILHFSDEESDSDLDDHEEDDLYFPQFINVFNLFRNDNHVKYLSFEEKQLISNLLIQGNFMDDVYFNMVKEHILTNRAYNHPTVDILNIRNVISINDVIDARTIKHNIYSCVNYEDKVTPDEQQELDRFFNIQSNFYNILIDEPQESEFLQLPEEIIEKILIMSTPDIDLNMINFSNMRLTCKKIHRIMFSKRFSKLILKKYSMLNLFNSKFLHTDEIPVRIFNNISYELIFGVFKNYLGSVIGLRLIKALGGFNQYFSLPFIEYCIDSKCLDNLCGNRCSYKYHYLYDYANAPVSRGIDSKGRFFILFFYRSENGIFYEFIYNNEKPRELNLTFSGMGMNTFIGNSTINYTNTLSAMYREIKTPSYNYIERLIKGLPCGEVYFKDGNLELAYEDKEKPVSLLFDKRIIKKYVKKNFDCFARPELYVKEEDDEDN